MIAGLLSAFVVLARPEAMGAETLLATGLLVALLAIARVLRAAGTPEASSECPVADGFAVLRVRLRVSDPAAAGHRRARAPGATR